MLLASGCDSRFLVKFRAFIINDSDGEQSVMESAFDLRL